MYFLTRPSPLNVLTMTVEVFAFQKLVPASSLWLPLNTLMADNLVEDLLGDFEYEVQVPYLLYRNAAQEVNGIWFYNSRECEDVAKLFSRSPLLLFSFKSSDRLQFFRSPLYLSFPGLQLQFLNL